MSAYTPKARDDFPLLADFARRPSGWDSALIDRRREAAAALDEIDELRRESESAPATIDAVAAALWSVPLAGPGEPEPYYLPPSCPLLGAVGLRDADVDRLAAVVARALAEAGWLKAPADEILTEADRAVLAAADEETAAGGTPPTDPKETKP